MITVSRLLLLGFLLTASWFIGTLAVMPLERVASHQGKETLNIRFFIAVGFLVAYVFRVWG